MIPKRVQGLRFAEARRAALLARTPDMTGTELRGGFVVDGRSAVTATGGAGWRARHTPCGTVRVLTGHTIRDGIKRGTTFRCPHCQPQDATDYTGRVCGAFTVLRRSVDGKGWLVRHDLCGNEHVKAADSVRHTVATGGAFLCRRCPAKR